MAKIQGVLKVYEPPLMQRSEQRVFYPEEIQEQFEDVSGDRREQFVESGNQV